MLWKPTSFAKDPHRLHALSSNHTTAQTLAPCQANSLLLRPVDRRLCTRISLAGGTEHRWSCPRVQGLEALMRHA